MDKVTFEQTMAKLTSKQRQVIDLLLAGKTDKEVAEEMGINRTSVSTYMVSIYRVFEVCTDYPKGSPNGKYQKRKDFLKMIQELRSDRLPASHDYQVVDNRKTKNFPPEFILPAKTFSEIGEPDILTADEFVTILPAERWLEGIGKLTIYEQCYPKARKHLCLFTSTGPDAISDATLEAIKMHCSYLAIKLTIKQK